ncbi:MAG: SPOR domain-containing protein [Pseudomonadota bacterium]
MEKRLYPMRIGVAAAGLALVLGGCAETQLGAQLIKSAARTTPAPAQPVAAAADPTLAPEAFDATGLTIWDGAATLQGIWFAHPLAQRAQRVRVINLQNGLITEGALFKRDPALSGPSILVSSDAARTLGLTPGAATELQIIALREGPIPRQTQTAVAAAGPAATPAVETASLAAPTPAADVAGGDETVLAAAVDANNTAPPESVAEIETTAAEPTSNVALTVDEIEAVTEVAALPAEETVEAIPAQAPAPTDTAQPELAQTAEGFVEPVAEGADETIEDAAPQATSAAIANADATVAVDPNSPNEELPELIAVDNSQIALAETQLLPPAPAARPPKPAPLEVPPLEEIGPADGELERGDYLQVGSFSIEPNAAILVQKLLRRGQPGRYVNRTINGKPFSIVIIGPLDSTVKERAAKDAAAAEGLKETIKVSL